MAETIWLILMSGLSVRPHTLGEHPKPAIDGHLSDVYASFTDADKKDLENYSSQIAQLVVQVRSTQNPAEIAQLNRKIEAYGNAIDLMADRYLGKLQDELQKAAVEALKVAAGWALKIIVASIA